MSTVAPTVPPAEATGPRDRGAFTGTAALTRLALRRDRVMLPVWVAVFVLTVWSSVAATVDLYPTVADRVQAASAINDIPSAVALYGRIWDPTSLGALSIVKLSGTFAAMLAVLTAVLTVRHTRTEEEAGRFELVGSTVVGRRAPLTAALLLALVAAVAIGVGSTLAMLATGLPGAGAVAFGLSWAAVGMCFAAVAAVAAQVTTTARGATGISVAAIVAAFLLRAAGDSAGSADGPGVLTWLSPLGWGQQVRPFAGDRFAVLLLPLAFTVACVLVAYALSARRDLGAGMLPERAGRESAPASLLSPLGLAWRLQRGTLLGWAIGFAVLGWVMGGLATNISTLLDNPRMAELLATLGGTTAVTDAFLAAVLAVVALVGAAYGVMAALRLRREEELGHTELVLAAAVSRPGWVSSHLVVALVGTALLQAVAGLAAGLADAAQSGDAGRVPAVVAAALVAVPAQWVLVGVVVLLFGLVPRLTALSWAVLTAFFLVGELGRLLEAPDWVLDVSPFTHVPRLPGMAMTWTPLIVLVLVAAALVAVGMVGFRRRDLESR